MNMKELINDDTLIESAIDKINLDLFENEVYVYGVVRDDLRTLEPSATLAVFTTEAKAKAFAKRQPKGDEKQWLYTVEQDDLLFSDQFDWSDLTRFKLGKGGKLQILAI